jgi:NTE family protein
MLMKREINTILLGGGGIRAVTFIGVFRKISEISNKITMLKLNLEESSDDIKKECIRNEIINMTNVNIKVFGGISAGSIFGLLYLIGYNPDEMESEIINKNLDQLKDIRFMNFVSKFGIDSGNNIIKWLESLMTKKHFDKDITFEDFYEKTNIDFQVFATNLNKYNFTKFNYIETPKLRVLDAVRMSISIPFMFTINTFNLDSKKFNDVNGGDTHVDGGLINSFPLFLYKDQLETTLGLKLVSHGELQSHNVNERVDDLESYIYHILACFMVQRDRKITLNKNYMDHTIYIDTQGITQTVNFGLSLKEKSKLIKIGYDEAEKYFSRSMFN